MRHEFAVGGQMLVNKKDGQCIMTDLYGEKKYVKYKNNDH